MPEFLYKASDRAGKIIEGTIDAGDETAVISKIRGMGYIPIRIGSPSGSMGLARSLNFSLSIAAPFTGVSNRELLAFTQELATLIKAGLPLDRALSIIAEITDNAKLKAVTQEILKDVRGGKSLSEALGRHPATFNRLFINMVKAGEAGGVLELVFERLADFLERSQELRSTITNAMIYPALLITIMSLVVAVMVLFILPKFTSIFDTMGQELPFSTQVLLSFSVFMKSYWWVLAGLGAGVFIWFKNFTRGEAGRLKWDTFKLNLFLVKDLILKVEVARLSRTLGTLINSGVPLLSALGIVKEIVGNIVIANAVATIQKAVKEGKGVSGPMRGTGIFPSLAIHMLRVGEETGNMEDMLIKVADTYDREVKNTVNRFLSFLEPGLIVVMALMVVAIIVPIILAIFSMNEGAF